MCGRNFSRLTNGWLKRSCSNVENGTIKLTRQGLLEVEQFLWDFFEPELKAVRYA